MSRIGIERRVAVAATDKDCDCRVSVRARTGDEKRMISVRQCSPKHREVVKRLHRITEDEIVKMLGSQQ